MIIGGSKKEVVANIKNAADNGRFNDKVEIGDPELDSTKRKKLLGKYVKQRNEIPYHYRNWLARRIVDFVSGGVYALDGYIQKVSNSIFLATPSNYEITNEMAREEMKNKLSVSWLKNNGVN